MIQSESFDKKVILQTLHPVFQQKEDIYLVGGAVRDDLLGIDSHDLDFVMRGDVKQTARIAARLLGGKFFMLDELRNTARVIVMGESRFCLDFALMRGNSLEEDLRSRDFTINSMAIDMKNPDHIIDPLRGSQDLYDRVLRTCSDETFVDDPVRVLRAIRLAFQYNLRIEKESLTLLKKSITGLEKVSVERKRDEFFRILEGNDSHSAVRMLEMLGVLDVVVPELKVLNNDISAITSKMNGWEYTFALMRNLDVLIKGLGEKAVSDLSGNLLLAETNSELGNFREKLNEYFSQTYAFERNAISLIRLASLFSVFALEEKGEINTDGNIILISPGRKKLSGFFMSRFGLSHDEAERISLILLNMHSLDNYSDLIIKMDGRGIHQYFNKIGTAALDIAFIKLAQSLTDSGFDRPSDSWKRWLSLTRILCYAWFEKYDDWIHPKHLLSGDEVQSALGITPGPMVGNALCALGESQAAGETQTYQQAVRFITEWYRENSGNPDDGG